MCGLVIQYGGWRWYDVWARRVTVMDLECLIKGTAFYMWRVEIIRMVLTWDTMFPLLILFSFGFISQPASPITRFDPRLAAVTDLPLSFAIIY